MYFTKDKVIYKPFEQITIFPLGTLEVPGYHLLKTEGERSKYGINTVPIYLKRDKDIEKQKKFARIKEEYPYTKFQELYAALFFRHLTLLYERVRVFYRRQHKLEVDLNTLTEIGILGGYALDRFGTFKNKIENIEVDFTKKDWLTIERCQYFYFHNVLPVICEKALGETTYNHPGVPLEIEDTLLLKLGKKEI